MKACKKNRVGSSVAATNNNCQEEKYKKLKTGIDDNIFESSRRHRQTDGRENLFKEFSGSYFLIQRVVLFKSKLEFYAFPKTIVQVPGSTVINCSEAVN